MVDPNPSELEEIRTLEDVWAWSGVDDGLSSAFIAVVGDIHLIRELVLLSDADFDEALAQCSDGGLTIIQKTRFRSARRVARLKCGLPASEPVPTSVVQPVAIAAPDASQREPGRKLKIASVLDQACDAEIVRMDPARVRQLFDLYTHERGDPPHPDVEPTAEQISALQQILKDDGVPYTDFAVFGPHGNRLVKRLTFRSFIHQPDGTWRRVELPGPPDFQSWWRCFRTLKTLLLLLGVVKVEHVDNYGEHIRDLHDKFGPRCWFLVYQADCRMRSEEFERIRRALESQHAKYSDSSLAALSDFNPDQPWNAVFKHSVSDRSRTFWDKEVRDKAFLYLGEIRSGEALLDDGTAQGSFLSGSGPSASDGPSGSRVTRPRSRTPRRTPRPPKSERADRSRKAEDGLYSHNKMGNEVCIKHNRGECSNPCPSKRSHQCSRCLRNDHVASNCPLLGKSSSDRSERGGKGGGRKGKSGKA
jgi:hypothetical protein